MTTSKQRLANSADANRALAHPTLSSRLARRLRDLPWRLMQLTDGIFPGEFESLRRRIAPYTMLEYGRLRGLYRAVLHVLRNDVAGDIVECGTARGGSAALLGLALQHMGAQRKLWVFDTFTGLPAPTLNDPDYEVAKLYTGSCLGTIEEVRDLFAQLSLLEDAVLVKGLFQDTLAEATLSQVALLHIDGDWYESVKCCLEQLYERVSPGGIIQIDDYGHWAGARKALDEFLSNRNISVRLRYLDYTGRQFTKPRDRVP